MRALTVGDGDFSYSVSLTKQFSSKCQLIATSFDSRELVLSKYGESAEKNIVELLAAGAIVLHGIDATALDAEQPRAETSNMTFDTNWCTEARRDA